MMGDLSTGSEITLAFERCSIIDDSGEGTKWRRICTTLVSNQFWNQNSDNVLSLIQDLLSPVRYYRNPEVFDDILYSVNSILKPTGLEYTGDGDFITLEEQSAVRTGVEANTASIQQGGPEISTRNVFVVHGRNEPAREALFIFLRAIGLNPLEWSEVTKYTRQGSPYIGDILDAAFSHAHAVVVLFTPDDEARLKRSFWGNNEHPYETAITGQARPNVLFEAGMAMGRNQERTVLIELGDLQLPSDLSGRHTIRMNNSVTRRQDLAHRLEDAGCTVNLRGNDWHKVGDFDAAV